jgi:hypothetical protein
VKLRLGIVVAMLAGGCITSPQNPAATQPSTVLNLATTQPSYWYDQPDAAVVRSGDFEKLWTACEDVARDYLFKISREEYRSGVLTTEPMVSGQWFEPWRRDGRSLDDSQENSIATIRRSIRFEFTRQSDNTWQMTPKILVERQSIAERRITSAVSYRNILAAPPRNAASPGSPGSREADQGILIQRRYWYPIHRDNEFERAVAQSVEKKLGTH